MLSITRTELTRLFDAENLPAPAVLSWPLTGEAENDRRRRAAAFESGLGNRPPPGLDWMRSHVNAKYNPEQVVEGCRAVLVTALGYYRRDEIDSLPAGSPVSGGSPPTGRIARYARGRDYHKELGNRLRRITGRLRSAAPDHQFRAFTDIGPLDETWLAEASGLGFKGRHTLAILPVLGSWVVLGHIVTTYPFQAYPGRPSPLACPEGCTRCIDACPSSALSMPGRLDASRCISYHTIEHKGPLEPVDRFMGDSGDCSPIGDRVFGCDACQEACPFNARAGETDVKAFLKDIAGASRNLRELLLLENRDEVVRRFAGSPLMRAGYEGLVRNACMAAGNSGDKTLIPILEKLTLSGSEGISVHARQALAKLS